MSSILEELLRPLPDLISVRDKNKGKDGVEVEVGREIKLEERFALEASYPKLNALITSIYGALFYAGQGQNADNLLPLIVEFLPEEKPLLRIMKKKAIILFEFYNSKSNQAEKAYNALTLLNAITAKCDGETSFQIELAKLRLKLQEEGQPDHVVKRLQKEKATLESLEYIFKKLKTVLEVYGKDIDAETAMALEPQKHEIIKAGEQLSSLLKKEKALLLDKMAASQKQVLSQAAYKIKNSFFFNQKTLDQSNLLSALLAEAVSKIELFENHQLRFTELIEEMNSVAKRTTAEASHSSTQQTAAQTAVNAALYAEAAPILMKLSHKLLQLKDEALKKEEALSAFEEILEETEKAVRMNKIKRALRKLEDAELVKEGAAIAAPSPSP